MALNFPSSPVDGETFTNIGVVWQWNASEGVWLVRKPSSIPDAPNDGSSYIRKNSVWDYSGHGQCLFSYVNSTTCRLSPYNGNSLVIDGASREIPSAGVDITNSVANFPTAGAMRYIYAYWTGSAIALEASATSYNTHTNGVVIKIGDPTRTLVGRIKTGADGTFQYTNTVKFVATWFNRRPRLLQNSSFASPVTQTSNANISNNYLNFICWSDSAIQSAYTITVNTPGTGTGVLCISIDGVQAYLSYMYTQVDLDFYQPVSGQYYLEGGLSESVYHYLGISSYVTALNMPILEGRHYAFVEI